MDEPKLVQALKGRDPAAMQELVAVYGDRLLRAACLVCGNETAAQDLVQETFLQALQSIHRFRGESGVYTWLRGILFHLRCRQRREQKRILYDNDLIGQAVAPADEKPSSMDLETTSSALTRALRQLSDSHREILVLRFYEDMKLEEIAQHLGVSTGTVKSRLHYAMAQMQELLPNEMNLFGVSGTERMERK